MANDQFVKLGLVRHKVFRKCRVFGHQHGVHLVEGQGTSLIDEAHAQFELGTGEMNDVVFVEQAVTFDAMAIDEGAVGAVFIGQPDLSADVTGEHGMGATQPEVGDYQVVVLAAADPAGQVGDHEVGVSTLGAKGL